MRPDTQDELLKIRSAFATIVNQLDTMSDDEEPDTTNAIERISDSVRAAILKTDIALLLPDSGQQYKPQRRDNDSGGDGDPRTWEVGDLCQTPESERFLALSLAIVDDNDAEVITERGNILLVDLNEIQGAKHNTGLQYSYTTHEQVLRDFESGFFTPYFEIL